jgi:hypothetical protein
VGVLDAPHVDDPAGEHSEEVDLVDVLEPAPGGRMAAPGPGVGGRAGEPADDLVVFGHDGDHLHVHVGK